MEAFIILDGGGREGGGTSNMKLETVWYTTNYFKPQHPHTNIHISRKCLFVCK